MRDFSRKLSYMYYYEIYSFLGIAEKVGSYVYYATVVAYLTTITQPFSIFRKLLAIIPSMKNLPHLIIPNQKINTNAKSPMLLIQVVL